MTSHPVLNYASLDSPVICHQQRLISLAELLHTVDYLTDKIPPHHHLLNLYEERYYFLLGFLLALKQQSITLLPSTVTSHTLYQLNEQYADLLLLSDPQSYPVSDESNSDLHPGLNSMDLKKILKGVDFSKASKPPAFFPELEFHKEIAIIFTSGSTGLPQPYIKQWGDLVNTANYLGRQLFAEHPDSSAKNLHALLATVPAQHMYGLDISIILALQNGWIIHSSRPFFPQDISLCLDELTLLAEQQQQSISSTLVTTPLHLKACLKTQISLSGLQQFISATAPLQTDLAQQCESVYSVPVMEVFGCTEVGTMAYRRTTESKIWQVLEDINLSLTNNADNNNDHDVMINTRRAIKQFLFNDIIELIDAQHFILKGRKQDLINLAGKRTSIEYLNHHLQSYSAFSDACYFQIAEKQDIATEQQLAAFVVLKNPEDKPHKIIIKNLRSYLTQRIDPIFLPKKIYFITQLPRNATGKLPRMALLQLMQSLEQQ